MRSLCREARDVVIWQRYFLFCFCFVLFFSINVLNNSHFYLFNSWSSGKMNMTERSKRQQVKSVLIHLYENVFETLI